MHDMYQLHTVIKLMVIYLKPVHRSCQGFDNPFGLGSIRPASNRLEGGIFTKLTESLIKYDLIILSSGLVHYCAHIIKPNLSGDATGVVEGIIQTLKQRILVPVKGQCDIFLSGKRQHI